MRAAATSICEGFLSRVAASPLSVLMLDYEGCLAPSSARLNEGLPYPEVIDALSSLKESQTRIVVVSGRPAKDVKRSLGLDQIEILGCHGAERLLACGRLVTFADEAVHEHLEHVLRAMTYERLDDRIELKPCSIAINWRGLTDGEVAEVRFATLRSLMWCRNDDFGLYQSDGGFEYRPRFQTKSKGQAIRQIFAELPDGTPLAYLSHEGPDHEGTDEDEFAVFGEGYLRVLVCQEHRTADARLCLKPPEQLRNFLLEWATASGGNR